nr:hypothetical protein [uncultured Lachnoclostridium sp.]
MKYIIDKGTEGIQDVLIVSQRECKLSRSIRIKECRLLNLLTLINYQVRVEYEDVEDSEIIVNLTVKAEYKGQKSLGVVIEGDCLHILDFVRLPADILPFVTELLLENQGGYRRALFDELLDDYNIAIQNGAEPENRDFRGFQLIRTTLSEDYCSLYSLGNTLQKHFEIDEDALYVRLL